VVTNASIATNGIITWTTPSQAQSLSTNRITTVVTDNGVPNLSATNSFTVIVKEASCAPLIREAAMVTQMCVGLDNRNRVFSQHPHIWLTNGCCVTNVAATNTSFTITVKLFRRAQVGDPVISYHRRDSVVDRLCA